MKCNRNEETRHVASLESVDDTYFGTCPYCGGNDGFFNIGRVHFFVCDEHKVLWPYGENLFRCWRDETQLDWDRNAKQYADYKRVTPTGFEA